MPSVYGLPPMFLATTVLLCADPMSSGAQEDAALASDFDASDAAYQVVASSPLPAGIGVGSHYGYRTSRRTGERTFHAGVDFLAPRGTPVYAVRGGIVEHVAQEGRRRATFRGYGNAIVVYHPDVQRWTFYAHLTEAFVEVGQRVEPGQRIGSVGQTTNGRFPRMVPHLHFEVRRARADGSSPFPGAYRRHNVDPEAWLADLGVRYEHDPEHDCVVLGEGELEMPAPVLVVRELDDALAVAASSVSLARL